MSEEIKKEVQQDKASVPREHNQRRKTFIRRTSKERDNLWNVTKHKSQRVIEYITLLEPNISWELGSLAKFDELKELALSQETANAKLEGIGYINHNVLPKIYRMVT